MVPSHPRDYSGPGIDRNQRSRIRQSAQDWRRQLGVAKNDAASPAQCGAVLALAYPDRLAQQRGSAGQFRMSNGRGAVLPATDLLAKEDFLAIGSLDGAAREARVFLAAPIALAEIEVDFAAQIETIAILGWNARTEQVEAKTQRKLWSLVLEERPLKKPPPEAVAAAMIEGIRAM